MEESAMKPEQKDPSRDRKPGLAETVGSVLAAAFGVQSSRNRQRDFKHGKARTFITAGILFTATLVLTLYLLVRIVLSAAAHN